MSQVYIRVICHKCTLGSYVHVYVTGVDDLKT